MTQIEQLFAVLSQNQVSLSERIRLFGFAVWVLSLEGLIRSKKAAGRPKDLNALPELEALLALRNRKS